MEIWWRGMAVVALVGALSHPAARADSNGMPMSEFHEVSPGIFRGSRPETPRMVALSRAGIRTDLDLEDDDEVIVFYQRWSPAAAYDEMLRMRFHPLLVFLDRYYKEKTEDRGRGWPPMRIFSSGPPFLP